MRHDLWSGHMICCRSMLVVALGKGESGGIGWNYTVTVCGALSNGAFPCKAYSNLVSFNSGCVMKSSAML